MPMATDLSVSEHLDGLREALLAFVRYADRAGLAAGVPTCPDWTVRELIAHLGMVHRFGLAAVRGEEPDSDAAEREGTAAADPIAWLRNGVTELTRELAEAPDDLEALVFLKNAPPAKAFWARRECHETVIHAVDALSAALGRYPAAADTWITPELALDGIDELLMGFLMRSVSKVRSDEPLLVAVMPDDADRSWLVRVGPGAPVATRHDGPVDGDVTVSGSAVEVYLTLWNRSDTAKVDDGGDLLDFWRGSAAV